MTMPLERDSGVESQRALATEPRGTTVYLAEDDQSLRETIAFLLRADGHRVVEISDASTLMAELAFAYLFTAAIPHHALLVTDLRLPGADSLSVIQDLQAKGRHPPFVLLTAFGEPEVHRRARHLGARAVFDKPFDLDELRSVVRNVTAGPSD